MIQMKNTFLGLLVLLSSFTGFAQTEPLANKMGYIETTGYSEKEIDPNRIYVYIRIDEKKNDSENGFKEWEKKMIKSLEKLGIDTREQLFTENMDSEVETYWIKKNKTFISKEYELVLYKNEMISKVFAQLQKLSVSAAYIKRIDHSEIEEIKLNTKITALIQAKRKARKMLESVGQQLGKLLYVYDYQNDNPYRYAAMDAAPRRGMAKLGASPESMARELLLKKIKVSSQISVRYEIK